MTKKIARKLLQLLIKNIHCFGPFGRTGKDQEWKLLSRINKKQKITIMEKLLLQKPKKSYQLNLVVSHNWFFRYRFNMICIWEICIIESWFSFLLQWVTFTKEIRCSLYHYQVRGIISASLDNKIKFASSF